MDCRVGGIRASLRGTDIGSKCGGEPAAERLESLALRAFGSALFSGRAALFSAEGLENCRRDCCWALRILGRGQLRKRCFSFGPRSRFLGVPCRCRGVLAGKPPAGDPGGPPAGSFLRFLGSSVDRAPHYECHAGTPGSRHECGCRRPVRVRRHAWSWRSTRKKSAASNATCWPSPISIWRPPALWAARFSACCRKLSTASSALCGCPPERSSCITVIRRAPLPSLPWG